MKPNRKQVEIDRYDRTRRKHSPKEKKDPVLLCTLRCCKTATAVFVLCFILAKTNPILAEKVSRTYLLLLQAPIGQTLAVWQQAAGEVGLPVLLEQVEESIMIYAQRGGDLPLGTGGQLDWDEQEEPLPEGVSLARPIFSVPASVPVNGLLSSSFGRRRHPITGKLDFHTGIDIAAVENSGIYAAWPGRVEETGSSAIYGNYITLDHGKGIKTSYCHCREILAKEGICLRAGERIATVGSTGISTGSHLHFEVWVNGQRTDPLAAFDL